LTQVISFNSLSIKLYVTQERCLPEVTKEKNRFKDVEYSVDKRLIFPRNRSKDN